MAVGTVPNHVTNTLSPLPLLLVGQQPAELLREDPVDLFHLPQLKLPTGALRCSQLVENVVI